MATKRTVQSTAKILVADDDRTTRFAISSMLKKASYSVTSVKDGAEALRQIQRINFDLAFLDIWMPRLTGLEVLARVRAGETRPKIIIMTSDGTPQSVLQAVKEQAYEYLSKPFLPKEAVEVAQRALEQNAVAPIEEAMSMCARASRSAPFATARVRYCLINLMPSTAMPSAMG